MYIGAVAVLPTCVDLDLFNSLTVRARWLIPTSDSRLLEESKSAKQALREVRATPVLFPVVFPLPRRSLPPLACVLCLTLTCRDKSLMRPFLFSSLRRWLSVSPVCFWWRKSCSFVCYFKWPPMTLTFPFYPFSLGSWNEWMGFRERWVLRPILGPNGRVTPSILNDGVVFWGCAVPDM